MGSRSCSSLGKTREVCGHQVCLDRRTVLNRPVAGGFCGWCFWGCPGRAAIAFCYVLRAGRQGRRPGSLCSSPCWAPGGGSRGCRLVYAAPGGSYSSLAPVRGDVGTPLLELAASLPFPDTCVPAAVPPSRGAAPSGCPSGQEHRHRVGVRSRSADVRKVGPLQLRTRVERPTHASRSGHDRAIRSLFFIKSPLDKFAKTTCLLVVGMPDLRSPGTRSSRGRVLGAAAPTLGSGLGEDVQFLFISLQHVPWGSAVPGAPRSHRDCRGVPCSCCPRSRTVSRSWCGWCFLTGWGCNKVT